MYVCVCVCVCVCSLEQTNITQIIYIYITKYKDLYAKTLVATYQP